MIRAILIDDEEHSNKTLRYELERHCPEVIILDEALSGAEGIEKIQAHKPNLVFLDIEMPGMSGFDLVKKLAPVDFDIIFVTAYDQYAIRAFRIAALDYLLKPITSEDLKQAINRVAGRAASEERQQQLEILMHNLRDGLKAPRIALPAGRGMDFVNVEDILYCSAESNYTHVCMQSGKKYTLAKTLKEIEQLLDQKHFFRIHQTYLVNMQHVQRYVRDDGGYVIMQDKSKIPIAKRRKEEFMSLLKGD
jgi:two-component system LytT family response regulator